MSQAKERELANDLRDKDVKFEQEKQRTADAQRAAAKAQLELKEYIDDVAKKQEPRGISDDILISVLKKAPPKRIIMLYQEGHTETYMFASHLRNVLIRGGWQVSELSPVISLVNIGGWGTGLREIILLMHHGELGYDESTSEGALWKALRLLKRNSGTSKDETLPEDTMKLYIGPKM